MKKNESMILNETIALLREKRRAEYAELKEQFDITYESLQPINLIKKSLTGLISSSTIQENIMNDAIGLTSGFLGKKLLVGASKNPIKKLAGTILQFVIGNYVASHAEPIKAVAGVLLEKVFSTDKDKRRDQKEV